MRNTKSIKHRSEHRCSRRTSGSYATSGTRHATLVTNPLVPLQADNNKMFKNQILVISIIHLIDILFFFLLISVWYWLPISIKQWLKKFSLPLYVRLFLGCGARIWSISSYCGKLIRLHFNGFTFITSLEFLFDPSEEADLPRVVGIRVVLSIFALLYLKGKLRDFYMLAKYVPGDIKYIFTKLNRHISTNNEANRKFVILISDLFMGCDVLAR